MSVTLPRVPAIAGARNAGALAWLTIKLATRDRRAFLFSFIFPLTFLFLYGLMAEHESPYMMRDLASRLVALTILVGSFFGQGLALAAQRERGMLRRYRLTPLGAGGLLAGTAMAGLVMTFLTLAIQLGVWRLRFGQPSPLDLDRFLLTAFIAALAMSALGLVVAAVAATIQEAQILFQMVFLASLVLADVTVPLAILPEFIRRLSVFLPATHAVSALRHALVGAPPLSADVPALAALALMTISCFFVASRLFRWERDDPLPRRAKWAALLGLLPVLAFGVYRNATMPVRPAIRRHQPPPPARPPAPKPVPPAKAPTPGGQANP